MKTRLTLVIFAVCALCSAPLVFTSCSEPPDQRVAQVQSLKAVGQTADAVVALSAQLYQNGQITATQARQVMDFYDQKFQPAYRVAVTAATSDLDSIASPDVVSLAAQLSALIISFQSPAK